MKKPKWTSKHDKIVERYRRRVAEGKEKEFVLIPRTKAIGNPTKCSKIGYCRYHKQIHY